MMLLEIGKVILGALIGGAIAYWIAHRVARKSGSFKGKEIDALLWGRSLISKPLDYIIFAYSPEVSPDDIAVCYLPIEIINRGALTLKEVIVNWKIPSIWRYMGPAEECKKPGFELAQKPIRRIVKRSQGYDYISYVIPKIDPNVMVSLSEYFNIAMCNWPFRVDVMSKDEVPLKIMEAVNIRVPVEISVVATDIPGIVRTFEVRGYQVESKEQLTVKISKPDLEDIKKDLKRRCPKTPDHKIEELAQELTQMGGLPRLEAMVVMAKLNKKAEYDNYCAFEQDVTQSEIGVVTQ